MEQKKNLFNLKIGQKCLIRHKSIQSPWIEVSIVCISEEGFPVGKNVEQDFYDSLTNEYEVDLSNSYSNEESALNYYWQMSH